jgi:protein-L-isoaspartate(D-aspartate) O-methyltransferase
MAIRVEHFCVRQWLIVALAMSFAGSLCAQNRPNFDDARERMVREDIVGAGIKNERVIEAMRKTPRHEFVLSKDLPLAYYDMSLPIGESQTISGPFVVAYMTEQLDPQPTDKVLEIGTGSGYQAAILSPLVKEVCSIEIVDSLGKKAARTLKRLKYTNVKTKIGDGYLGWEEHAPFDKIIVTCSPEKVPQPLVDQLKEGGRMIVPVGERYTQELYLLRKQDGKLVREMLVPTMFVPMTGKAESAREVKPDPTNPRLANSSFEELAGNSGEPASWYYPRLMTVKMAADAPDGEHYIHFQNDIAGRTCRVMQGFALDGRKVRGVEMSVHSRGNNIGPGQSKEELPVASISFFDENRSFVGREWIGPWRGSFDWQHQTERFRVPVQCREALVQVGLFGATGELDVDGFELRGIDPSGLPESKRRFNR